MYYPLTNFVVSQQNHNQEETTESSSSLLIQNNTNNKLAPIMMYSSSLFEQHQNSSSQHSSMIRNDEIPISSSGKQQQQQQVEHDYDDDEKRTKLIQTNNNNIYNNNNNNNTTYLGSDGSNNNNNNNRSRSSYRVTSTDSNVIPTMIVSYPKQQQHQQQQQQSQQQQQQQSQQQQIQLQNDHNEMISPNTIHHEYHQQKSSASSTASILTSSNKSSNTTTVPIPIPCQSHQRYYIYPFNNTIMNTLYKNHTAGSITRYVYIRIPLPPSYIPMLLITTSIITLLLMILLLPKDTLTPDIKIAMIGNSMMYYNDLPRFLETISNGHIQQDSCLHGNANFNTILTWGNGMYNIWNNGDSRIYNYHHGRIHDYGACTVEQLLFGKDSNLDDRMYDFLQTYVDDDYVVSSASNVDYYTTTTNDDANYNGDDMYSNSSVTTTDDLAATDDTDDRLFQQSAEIEKVYSDDFYTYYDGSNPCLRNPYYYYYLENKYQYMLDKWDYIILNDNTRTPARNHSRYESIDVLNSTYLPWIQKTGAVPIFLATYGYWTPYRDMGGLGTIAQFTSLTHEGYNQYKLLLQQYLPIYQTPRIAPVGIAFLLIYEENYDMWLRLFHVDQIHCSPLGTYLQGLVLYHTIYNHLPDYDIVIRPDMSTLFLYTRRFQPGDHRRDPYPTMDEASYLYNIAKRIVVHKQYPKTFIKYNNNIGSAVDYVPQDDIYKQDDLF